MIKIEITTIEDFMAFVAIIQGKEPNIELLKQMANKLNTGSNKLEEAVEHNKGV